MNDTQGFLLFVFHVCLGQRCRAAVQEEVSSALKSTPAPIGRFVAAVVSSSPAGSSSNPSSSQSQSGAADMAAKKSDETVVAFPEPK